MIDFPEEKYIHRMNWTSKSPDLSAIEQDSDGLGRDITRLNPYPNQIPPGDKDRAFRTINFVA